MKLFALLNQLSVHFGVHMAFATRLIFWLGLTCGSIPWAAAEIIQAEENTIFSPAVIEGNHVRNPTMGFKEISFTVPEGYTRTTLVELAHLHPDWVNLAESTSEYLEDFELDDVYVFVELVVWLNSKADCAIVTIQRGVNLSFTISAAPPELTDWLIRSYRAWFKDQYEYEGFEGTTKKAKVAKRKAFWHEGRSKFRDNEVVMGYYVLGTRRETLSFYGFTEITKAAGLRADLETLAKTAKIR